ncbi:Mannosylfructose-phosphate phosphatase [Mucisphaera calidilacus]|uniref:Mannosylfructose-phosphate phosphatase n=2 Tax=Mucisphaera calidilacus TaxID=2527982 RepID=A0A518C046_9BACT|nr:Mannosylfructose-phosphate phosphatase [Mucisphaera calidilacus]
MSDAGRCGWLLVSDIDDTFLGDAGATLRLIREAGRQGVAIALNSSRPWVSVAETVAGLPEGWRPRATITAMGTQVRIDEKEQVAWAERFGGWSRGPFDALAAERGWVAHEAAMQTAYKASYALPEGADRDAVREQILAAGRALVVISGGGDLDVLPVSAGKGPATVYLAGVLGFGMDRVVVAGDSANDLGMFEVAERAIAVGNARAELTSRADPERTYFARGCCAGGIIEGLMAYGVLSD